MQHLQPSTTLQGGKYRIERVLGQGGFGITYLAEQVSLGRKVAIKEFFMKDFCLRDDVTNSVSTPSTGSSQQVEMYKKKFIKEANNLARLKHPNIISIIEVFEENETVYYAMPYLSGGSLHDYVKTHGALSESEAMKYVRQIANALKYMQEEMHICHLDVKPANILIDDHGSAILIDFGISKNYDEQGGQTSTTPVGKSDGYAPIEQYVAMGVSDFSPVSDVYALGATLFFLLHGKSPVSAPKRAGGAALLMKKSLLPNIKSIINASMKISKAERAQSLDVFLRDKIIQNYIVRKCNVCGYKFNVTDKRDYCPICHSKNISEIDILPPDEDEQTFVATKISRSSYQNSEETSREETIVEMPISNSEPEIYESSFGVKDFDYADCLFLAFFTYVIFLFLYNMILSNIFDLPTLLWDKEKFISHNNFIVVIISAIFVLLLSAIIYGLKKK